MRKKAAVITFISDKMYFKTKTERSKEGCYIRIKELIQQEDVKLVSVHAHNIRAPK